MHTFMFFFLSVSPFPAAPWLDMGKRASPFGSPLPAAQTTKSISQLLGALQVKAEKDEAEQEAKQRRTQPPAEASKASTAKLPPAPNKRPRPGAEAQHKEVKATGVMSKKEQEATQNTAGKAATAGDEDDDGILRDLSPDELKALKKRFRRSLSEVDDDPRRQGMESSARRGTKTEMAPKDVALQCMHSGAEAEHWFQTWVKNWTTWAGIKAHEEFVQDDITEKGTVRCWMTEAQLQDFYTSAEVAAAVVSKKKARHGWNKPHPEVPECAEARLYVCLLSQTESEVVKSRHSRGGVRAEAMFEDEAGHMLMQNEGGRMGFEVASVPKEQHPEVTPEPLKADAPVGREEEEEDQRIKDEEEQKKKKDEEEKKKEEERKHVAEKKMIEKEMAKEAAKTDPKKIAGKWLSGVTNYIVQMQDLKTKCEADGRLDAGIQKTFAKNFASLLTAMTDLRTDIERLNSENDSERLKKALKAAESSLPAVKADMKSFTAVWKTYHPKSKP